MEIDKRINQANGRLKSALIKVAIERRGGTLSLRATLPAKEAGRQPYRQKIALGVKATPAGLQFAERRARELANDLDAGRFAWKDWLEQDDSESESRISVAEWVRRYEEDYWNRRDRNSQSQTTWNKDYRTTFNKLPANKSLTTELLIQVIEQTPADSRNRKRTVQVLSRLAKFAGLSVEFGHLVGSYSAKRVNPRSLPPDSLIVQVRDGLKHEGWRWVLGMIACYGLRPHEVFLADLSEFPVIIVPDSNKTKTERFVYPLYPEWAEKWGLGDRKLPNLQNVENLSNAKIGTKISGEFYDRKLPFKPYDLRHCYARRCFEFSLPPDLAAGLMGHSIQVHIQTYRAWIDRATYRRAYEALINRENAPKAPL
ncbi:integrase [Oscillatoria sp. FACHB-1407]|nr:integrase [Oscillatoria sp. FACHB-1407]